MANLKSVKRERDGVRVVRKTVRLPEYIMDSAKRKVEAESCSINSVLVRWLQNGSVLPVETELAKMPIAVHAAISQPWESKAIVYIPVSIAKAKTKALLEAKRLRTLAKIKTNMIAKRRSLCEAFVYSYWIIAGAGK